MKKILLLSVFGFLCLFSSFNAKAQLHNMGVDMSILWPQGGFRHDFNSLYGGFFYEYRFQGEDIDVNEFIDHIGLECGIQYTEFLFKNNYWDVRGSSNYEVIPRIKESDYLTRVRSNNKGFNLYLAPKYYFTLYPELLEGYVMGKLGYQYLNGKGTLKPVNALANQPDLTSSVNSNSIFFGGFVGVEVKLGSVFVGANFGIDSNSAYSVMKKQTFKPEFAAPNITGCDAFKGIDKMKSNLILEFRVKALLNGED